MLVTKDFKLSLLWSDVTFSKMMWKSPNLCWSRLKKVTSTWTVGIITWQAVVNLVIMICMPDTNTAVDCFEAFLNKKNLERISNRVSTLVSSRFKLVTVDDILSFNHGRSYFFNKKNEIWRGSLRVILSGLARVQWWRWYHLFLKQISSIWKIKGWR